MGKEHNIRRTTWVFTFMVVVSLQTYTKYLNTLYQNPHIQTSLPPPPKKKTPKKTTTNNIVNLQNSNPRLNSPWCEKKWRRGLFLDARKICPLFRKLLLALLDCDKYRIIQVFSDESCADPDNFFPGGFRDIFLEF